MNSQQLKLIKRHIVFNSIAACVAFGFLILNTFAQDQKMDCDSTCITPQPVIMNKTNTSTTTNNMGQFNWGPRCGPSAGSVLPSAPSTFLCENSTPSAVSTTTANGETLYNWSCTAPSGSQVSCTANQREVGMCGASNGTTTSSNPSNLCSSGGGVGFSLIGSLFRWQCQGNYGAAASCSATYYSPPPPVYQEPTCQFSFSGTPLPPCPYTSPAVGCPAGYGYTIVWYNGMCA